MVFGKFRRGDAVPVFEMAKNIADAFNVTLDYLVDESSAGTFDKKTVGRIKNYRTCRRKSSDTSPRW